MIGRKCFIILEFKLCVDWPLNGSKIFLTVLEKAKLFTWKIAFLSIIVCALYHENVIIKEIWTKIDTETITRLAKQQLLARKKWKYYFISIFYLRLFLQEFFLETIRFIVSQIAYFKCF